MNTEDVMSGVKFRVEGSEVVQGTKRPLGGNSRAHRMTLQAYENIRSSQKPWVFVQLQKTDVLKPKEKDETKVSE